MNCINLYAVVLSEVMSRMERPQEHATAFTVASVLIIVIMSWFVWYFDIIACGWLVEHFFAPIQAFVLRLLHATAVKLGLRSEVAGPAGRDTLPDLVDLVETLLPAPLSVVALPPRPNIMLRSEVAGQAGRDTLPEFVETLSPAPPSVAALPPRPNITVAGETLPLVEHFFAPIQAFALRLLHATAVKLGLRSEVAGPAGRDTLPDLVETLSPAPPSVAGLPPRPNITVAGETLPTQAQLDLALSRAD